MTKEEIERLRALLANGTQGEWYSATNDGCDVWALRSDDPEGPEPVSFSFRLREDAELAAAAVNALPFLLDRNAELAKLLHYWLPANEPEDISDSIAWQKAVDLVGDPSRAYKPTQANGGQE